MLNKVLFVFIVVLLISCNKKANDCLKNRAAFDIGSGSTKVKVAEVDICRKKITKFLYEEEIPIGFKADLQMKKSGKENMLSEEIQKYGFEEIKKINNKLKNYKLSKVIGVATSAFRTANNAIYFFSKIQSELGINIEIVDQLKEAEVGLYSAATAADKKPEDIIVWDIGGGSMQMIAVDNGKIVTYLGKIGAVSFKDKVISIVQKKNPEISYSPNPMNMEEFKKGILLAKALANENVSKDLKKIFKSGREIYGIGGVHSYCVYDQVGLGNDTYTLEGLKKIYAKRVGLTDKEIGGSYSVTDITNLALVSGYMEILEISKINILKVNLTEGILVYPEILAK